MALLVAFVPLVSEKSKMFLQLSIIVALLLPFTIAHENASSAVPIVVVSQHQLRKDIRKEVTAAVHQTSASINNSITELTRNVNWTVADIITPVKDQIIEEVNATLHNSIVTVIDSVELLLKPLLDEIALSGKSSINPATSCEEIKSHGAAIPSGYYWIQTSSHPLVQVYCEMTEIELVVGSYPNHPADSCKQINRTCTSDCPSGYYWIKGSNETSIRVYCDMTRTCGGVTGGWMQVANINMSDTSHTCPPGLIENNTLSVRSCTKSYSPGCSAAAIDTFGIGYSHVCGKIIGYQYGRPQSFIPSSHPIDRNYVDGVSLTHGTNPRQHIWTFAAAIDEELFYTGQCSCVNTCNTRQPRIPSWVGNDYFCDTGAAQIATVGTFYRDDPLWDGEGCGEYNTCCSFNTPPWFSKQLSNATTDNIDLRICSFQSQHHQGVFVKTIELYVQ